MERRDFLKVMTVAAGLPAAAGGLLSGASAADEQALPLPTQTLPETVRGDMRYRPLGRTGVEVSLLGVGGFHIGTQKDEADSIKIIRTAIDSGVNFLDNSWDYNQGTSEERMGKALRDGYRKKVFLMTKIDGRTKEAAAKQLDESLRRFQTDMIDLVQHHEVIRMEDPDRIFGPGGAQEALLAARDAGKIRFIGFTGHKDPLVHLRMLEVAARHNGHLDTAQMPLNVLDAHFRSFARLVVPACLKAGIGVLGMKSLASGMALKSKAATAVECLHYAMNLPASVVISGMDSLDVLKQNLDAVRTFRPMSPEQVATLLGRTAQAAEDGKYELFKTNTGFDATAHHPEWLG